MYFWSSLDWCHRFLPQKGVCPSIDFGLVGIERVEPTHHIKYNVLLVYNSDAWYNTNGAAKNFIF